MCAPTNFNSTAAEEEVGDRYWPKEEEEGRRPDIANWSRIPDPSRHPENRTFSPKLKII